ncbi:PLG [Mytilus edulis]|uniref:PLG n=1 Tax=Mytilus edulis TaxID=6550 RepID=A0A8S3PQP8_MYTED|nr:PLG [Mytilus edulis]
MQLTGHTNVASINDYSSASLDQQIKMSNILSDIGSGGKSVCTEPAVMKTQTVNMIKSSDIDFPNEDNLILADMDLQAIDNYESNCKVDQYGESYEGKINTTISGRTCQSWKLQSPHQHERDPFDHNYCRNPSKGYPGPWCYTTDIRVRSEYCPVYLCGTNCSKGFFRCKDGKCIIDYWQCNGIADCAEAEDESFCDEMPECLEDGKSVLYRGKRNVTASGIPCQYWSSTSPHSHTYQFNAENYCRNSDRTTLQAWCYTQDANVRWEYCDIPVCPFVTTVSQPETSTESQLVTSTVSQPVTSTVSQPVTSTVLQPVTSTVSQPVTSTVSQPVTSTVSQPVTSTVSQPVTSFESQPVTSTVSQPVTSTVSQPVTSTESQPVTSNVKI